MPALPYICRLSSFVFLWNLICQVHPCLPWFTVTIGSRVAVAGISISRGEEKVVTIVL
ncbi:hypothetical protein SAMN05192558_1042 [Actinokineospora alba]|uniref:Uncharacterized protein n=1 Tax=Actinokineospora alba TaxID=504798 RepID=A0A1H0L4C6_9PSEU|nr:hypothetical protein C8E96_2721 [Actinokineospora alba]SDJ04993.1 hypothetical protein SAMN05421871_109297 [Actinokineospora alba]SDO62886.1 hypothetical protein SAMN05192558_1042 [Actinokineospora alba]